MRFSNSLFGRELQLLLIVSLLIAGCHQKQTNGEFVLQSGDLLFQDIDCGPLCDAIEKVTTGYGGANFSHVGIAARNENSDVVVIEAVRNGVTATPLQDFLKRSLDAEQQPKVVVGRLKPPFRHLIRDALAEGRSLEGKAYDKVFVIDNDSYYCSELIYEIFLRANGNNALFSLDPMTFKDPDTGITSPAWEEYYSDLGVAVQEGMPGINPGGISRSKTLTIVHAYSVPKQWR